MRKTPSFSQKLNKNFFKKWLKLGVFCNFHFLFLAKHGVFEDWRLGRARLCKFSVLLIPVFFVDLARTPLRVELNPKP